MHGGEPQAPARDRSERDPERPPQCVGLVASASLARGSAPVLSGGREQLDLDCRQDREVRSWTHYRLPSRSRSGHTQITQTGVPLLELIARRQMEGQMTQAGARRIEPCPVVWHGAPADRRRSDPAAASLPGRRTRCSRRSGRTPSGPSTSREKAKLASRSRTGNDIPAIGSRPMVSPPTAVPTRSAGRSSSTPDASPTDRDGRSGVWASRHGPMPRTPSPNCSAR